MLTEPTELVDTIRAAPSVDDEWLHDHRVAVLEACAEHRKLTRRQARKLLATRKRDVLIALALRSDGLEPRAEHACRAHGLGWILDYRRTGDISGCPVRVLRWGEVTP